MMGLPVLVIVMSDMLDRSRGQMICVRGLAAVRRPAILDGPQDFCIVEVARN